MPKRTPSYRQRTGYDQAIPDETVVIHHVDTSRANPAWVQDETWDSDPNDEGARWDLGETFYDSGFSTIVHVQEVDASGSLVIMSNSARPMRSRASFGGTRESMKSKPRSSQIVCNPTVKCEAVLCDMNAIPDRGARPYVVKSHRRSM